MEWFGENYNRLKNICKSITKENNVDELLHYCIDKMIDSEKFELLKKDSDKIYYFTRVVLNNYNSKTSPYHTRYRNSKITNLDGTDVVDIVEEHDIIDMEWVRKQLKEIMKDEWYYGRLFELYIEEGCNLTKLNKRTTIPLAPLSRDINRVRKILIKKRKEQNVV